MAQMFDPYVTLNFAFAWSKAFLLTNIYYCVPTVKKDY